MGEGAPIGHDPRVSWSRLRPGDIERIRALETIAVNRNQAGVSRRVPDSEQVDGTTVPSD